MEWSFPLSEVMYLFQRSWTGCLLLNISSLWRVSKNLQWSSLQWCGVAFQSCGVAFQWCGVAFQWCGVAFQWYGVAFQSCGIAFQSCGVAFQSCGVAFQSCGVAFQSCGVAFQSCGVAFQSCGVAFQSCGVAFQWCGVAFLLCAVLNCFFSYEMWTQSLTPYRCTAVFVVHRTWYGSLQHDSRTVFLRCLFQYMKSNGQRLWRDCPGRYCGKIS